MEKEYLLEWPPPDNGPIKKRLKTTSDSNDSNDNIHSTCNDEVITTAREMELVKKDGNNIHSLLAQWWKWKRQQDGQQETLSTDSTNPNTLLHHISKLQSAKRFIKLHLDHIENQPGNIDLVSMACCYFLLGDIGAASTAIKEALSQSHHDDEESRIKWLACVINKQSVVSEQQLKLTQTITDNVTMARHTLPIATKVERRDCANLSFKEFFLNYASTHTPLIITGLNVTKTKWTLEYVKTIIGDKMASLKRQVKGSIEWAQLEDGGEMKVKDFIDSLHHSEKSLYLFDWSIPLHCPELVQDLIIPKYFAGDFLQRTPGGSLYQDSWPSLFIAPAGVHSSLHVDAFGSNFWMALFEGTKRWLFFPPGDLPCLYPVYNLHSTDPTFEIDLLQSHHEEHPLVMLTHPMECILQPGEVLFVPAGSPHQVENLTPSLAISANFVDNSNIALVREELEIDSLVDPRAADLLRAFNDDKFHCEIDKLQDNNLTWNEFKTCPREPTHSKADVSLT